MASLPSSPCRLRHRTEDVLTVPNDATTTDDRGLRLVDGARVDDGVAGA